MKFKVKVEDRTFDVEVGDLNSRPIIATVEGDSFEVWPEEATGPAVVTPVSPSTMASRPPLARSTPPPRPSRRTSGEAAAPRAAAGRMVYAPIPGVIDSIAVHPGDSIGVGDELCILEAMKMKNVIRAARAGQIAQVVVSPGQHVKHNDALLEYAE